MDTPVSGAPEHAEESARDADAEAAPGQPAGAVAGLLRLQQLAGNRAVARSVDEATGTDREWAGPSWLGAASAAARRSDHAPASRTETLPAKIRRAAGTARPGAFPAGHGKIQRSTTVAAPAAGLVQRESISTSIGGPAVVEAGAGPEAGRGPGRAGRAKVKFSSQGSYEMPIEGYSFGGASPTEQASGLPTGRIEMESVVLTRQSDDLSPLFVNALGTNELFDLEVKLKTEVAGGTVTTATYRFRAARLNNLTQSGGSGAGTETLSIDFDDVELETPAGGEATTPVDAPATLALASTRIGDFSVPVLSWNWALASPGASGIATGATQHTPVSMTIAATTEAAMLLNAFSTNETFTTAKLTPTSGPDYTLANARVTKYHHAATNGQPTATIELTYQTLGQQAGNRETQLDRTDSDES